MLKLTQGGRLKLTRRAEQILAPEVRQYDPTAPVDAKTRNALQAVRPLPQLPNVRWHVEVLHDRIWLADPPYAPFRPRSMFVFDAGRLQMLGMAPHANCRPITADELLDFLAKTCLNHNIRPGPAPPAGGGQGSLRTCR